MKLYKKLFALAFAALALTACDEIDIDKRFSDPIPIIVEAEKNVLIEDFTGQQCMNCPLAAEEIHKLQEVYGADRLIAVSVHGGSNALSETKSPQGLANAQGNDYVSHWSVTSFPKGWVDRSGSIDDKEKWAETIKNRFNITPKVDIKVVSHGYTADANGVETIKLTVKVIGKHHATGKLQVWLTENNVIKYQLMDDGTKNYNYQHNHVFRASISAPYGDELAVSEGESISKDYEYQFPDFSTLKNKTPWVPANLSIVAFYYNDSEGVMQVVDQPLLTGVGAMRK